MLFWILLLTSVDTCHTEWNCITQDCKSLMFAHNLKQWNKNISVQQVREWEMTWKEMVLEMFCWLNKWVKAASMCLWQREFRATVITHSGFILLWSSQLKNSLSCTYFGSGSGIIHFFFFMPLIWTCFYLKFSLRLKSMVRFFLYATLSWHFSVTQAAQKEAQRQRAVVDTSIMLTWEVSFPVMLVNVMV